MVWSWDVASDRAQPGCTLLENVSARGFRSAVRQWLPDGAPIPEMKLSIESAPRLYPPGSTQTITVELAESASATAGKPVRLRVKFWNKGGTRLATGTVKWESPDAGVTFAIPSSGVFGLARGESAMVPVTFTADTGLPQVRMVAVDGASRIPLSVPVFPPAEPAASFQIADGATLTAYQHGTQPEDVTFGEGNHDGHAAPGESCAVLFPEGEYPRG